MRSVQTYLPARYSIATLLFCIGYVLMGISGAAAQVQITPFAVYLSDGNQTGRMLIRNPSNKPVELNIKLLFGYPATNQEGKVYLRTFETVPENEPSALDWIRVYPRHLILPPGEQQTIRFAARPPANLPRGEYWVRPAITARSINPQESNTGKHISTQINVIKRFILSLKYRHGSVRTGITLRHFSAKAVPGTLKVYVNAERKGNAAWLGHVDIRIHDASGDLQKHIRRQIAVYHLQKRIFDIDTSGMPPGVYRVDITLSTSERAAKNENILPAPPVSVTTTVAVI